MSEFRSMPMYWEAFFTDMVGVDPEVAKAHLFLIGHAWVRGAKLVDDDLALARMAGVGPRKWAAIKGAVLGFWRMDESGCWTQKRLSAVFAEVKDKVAVNIENGKLGGLRSAEKRRTISTDAPERTVKRGSTKENERERDSSLRSESNSVSASPQRLSTPPKTADVDALPQLPLLTIVDGGLSEDPTTELPKKKTINGEQLRFIGEQWNTLAASLSMPQIEAIKPGSARERQALARLREIDQEFPSIEDGVGSLLAKIRASPFLRGESGGFRCTFDWVTNATNFQKIMEGNYEAREKENRRNDGSNRTWSRH